MSNLKEIKAAMPADFAEEFKNKADEFGMTIRQLAAVCIAIGFKSFCAIPAADSLPSEPSPVLADEKTPKVLMSSGAESAGAKRSLPFISTLLGFISHKKTGDERRKLRESPMPLVSPLEAFQNENNFLFWKTSERKSDINGAD